MKKVTTIFALLFLAFFFYSFVLAEHTITSILKQLDLSEENAKDHTWSNICYSNFSYPAPKALKNLSGAERTSIVKIVGSFVESYTKSEEFAAKYKDYMLSLRPEPPQKPESVDDSKKKQKEELTKTIAEMEANKKNMASDQQAIIESTIKAVKEQLKELDNPDNPLNSRSNEIDSYSQTSYEEQMKQYNEKLAQWEKESNGGPKPLVKKWLEKFLDETSQIDFNAALREENGKKKFINSEYEKKSHLWKLCYRAGKGTTEAARSFVQSWLDELK
ncbi:MAG: hypothetical protein ACM3MI_06090 [Clostridiales bacterium]